MRGLARILYDLGRYEDAVSSAEAAQGSLSSDDAEALNQVLLHLAARARGVEAAADAALLEGTRWGRSTRGSTFLILLALNVGRAQGSDAAAAMTLLEEACARARGQLGAYLAWGRGADRRRRGDLVGAEEALSQAFFAEPRLPGLFEELLAVSKARGRIASLASRVRALPRPLPHWLRQLELAERGSK